MSNASSLTRTAQLNRDALIAALRQDLSSTRRMGAIFGVLGLVAVLAGIPSLQQFIDAGPRELAYRVLLIFLGVPSCVGGLLCFWLAPRYTRRLVQSVEADERSPMLMTVEREVLPGEDERIRFVATLFCLRRHRVVLRDVYLRHGDKRMAYPYDEGVTNVPVEVYGMPGEGPIVIDAGWGFLLPTNRTYPWFT
ncbi:hypothetical protein [Myxococcus sp. Y35]|uniref:hypothetical protein n=1 Tax=Pseudomyxococcus flavus TaxID=3115648 RepID=UPI003CE7F482